MKDKISLKSKYADVDIYFLIDASGKDYSDDHSKMSDSFGLASTNLEGASGPLESGKVTARVSRSQIRMSQAHQSYFSSP